MSMEALIWAWDIDNVTPLERLCLLALAEGAQEDATITRPNPHSLARKLHVDAHTSNALIESLIRAGLCAMSTYGPDYYQLRLDRTRGEQS